jgi:hypothetical protein
MPAHGEGLLTNVLTRVGAKAWAYNSTYLDDSPAVEVKVVVEEVDRSSLAVDHFGRNVLGSQAGYFASLGSYLWVEAEVHDLDISVDRILDVRVG